MTDLDTLFTAAAEPLVLVKETGRVTWANASFQLAFGTMSQVPTLEAILPRQQAHSLLTTQHYLACEVEPTQGPLTGQRQTAIALDVSSGSLEERLFLILFASAAAESALVKEKEQWLSTVAHDLKNPLSAIFGYSDTLLDTPLGQGLTAGQREILARIRATAARATELVRNYQHISHIALRGVSQTSTRTDVNSAIHDVLQSTWREDPQHPRVALDLLAESLPAAIDRLYLDRILSNLFSNALKFSPPDSTVTIRTGRTSRGPWISFHNWGAPIPMEEHSKMFAPYSRLSTSKGKPGSGLGLSIVKQIVDGLGGCVHVQSTAQGGTTFTVELP
jgi:signal transduction histidine kinase